MTGRQPAIIADPHTRRPRRAIYLPDIGDPDAVAEALAALAHLHMMPDAAGWAHHPDAIATTASSRTDALWRITLDAAGPTVHHASTPAGWTLYRTDR